MIGPLRCRGQVKLKAFCYSRGFVGGKGCGLQIGLQILGRHLDDATVLRAAAAYEAASPWKDKWPPMLAQMGL